MWLKHRVAAGLCAGMMAVGSVSCARAPCSQAPMLDSYYSIRTSDPLEPLGRLDFISKSQGMPALERTKLVFDYLREGGRLGIKYMYGRPDESHMPMTAPGVLKAGGGDCTDLAFLMVSGFRAAGLDDSDDVKLGALLGTMRREREFLHISPVLLIKGDIPASYRYKRYEEDPEFRSRMSKALGIPGNPEGWHMVMADPQAFLGEYPRIWVGPVGPVDVNGMRGIYYRNFAQYFARNRDYCAAQYAFKRAIGYNGNDASSYKNLAALLYADGETEEASRHMEKTREICAAKDDTGVCSHIQLRK